jgi:tetratricopeptide (TPR) repeat protein
LKIVTNNYYLDEWFNKVVDFLGEGEYRNALCMFLKVLSLNPDDAEVWSYAGEILGRLDKYKARGWNY